MKNLMWLALAGAALAPTAAAATQPPVECNLAACFVYEYVGEIDGVPIWVLIDIRPRGGPNVN
jgi:hypothetical protein